MSMWDITDVKDDVVEHVNIISTRMKKTVSGPFNKRPQDESTPLLQMGGNNASTSADYTTSNEVSN